MARAALRRRLTWQTGIVVKLAETTRTRTIVLNVPGWPGHRAGQHVDIRLTAADGYQAERSYSIASAPGDTYLEFTVERVPDGEVSLYLVDELREGDVLELRGPVGGYFVWQQDLGGPLLLIASGSGMVPLRSILRHHRRIRSAVPVRLLYSVRDPESLIYGNEIMQFATSDEVDVTLTSRVRCRRDGTVTAVVSTGDARRSPVGCRRDHPLVYICGPTTFVETAAIPARRRRARPGADPYRTLRRHRGD
jgi:ferredoxin-NADP reductase